jgi:hypothetical protein
VFIADAAAAVATAPAMVDAAPSVDATASVDATPENACDASLVPGQLLIDELMIESVKGSGDEGEWLEVANAAACSVDLRGLHAESPRGTKVATLDVSDDVWLAPGATFVIADSTTPAIDHYLPGLVYGWLGHPSDVLRNAGTTISLLASGTLVDSITYPALTLTVGTALEYPSDCDAASRADWTRWQPSSSTYFPSFHGTPNAANDDVHCP